MTGRSLIFGSALLLWLGVLGAARGQTDEGTRSPSQAESKRLEAWRKAVRHRREAVRASEEQRKLGDRLLLEGIEFVWIPPGKFQMGSPPSERGRKWSAGNEQRHEVTLTVGFYIAKTEVTKEQFKRVLGREPWAGQCGENTGDDYPASYVGWNDAMEFCQELGEKAGQRLPPGLAVRLPTEAEWEYACRAGSQKAYCFGDDPSELGAYAWYTANAQNHAHRVATKKPNAWGLYDMHGNVIEWCLDEPGSDGRCFTDGIADPLALGGQFRVQRGGCCASEPIFCRSAFRWVGYTFGASDRGFRPVLAVPAPPVEETRSGRL